MYTYHLMIQDQEMIVHHHLQMKVKLLSLIMAESQFLQKE